MTSHDAAKIVDGGRGGLVFTKFVDGRTGKMMIPDQCIGGFGDCMQCLPKTSAVITAPPPEQKRRITFAATVEETPYDNTPVGGLNGLRTAQG